jgi:integrase
MSNFSGCRGLERDEIERLKAYFGSTTSKTAYRDQALIWLGFYTGFRISELLSIRVKDILLPNGRITDWVCLKKANTKGKKAGRNGQINDNLKPILEAYLSECELKNRPESYLFPSPRGDDFPITARQGERIYKKCFDGARIEGGKLATHSGRKTFAKMVYEAVGNDLLSLQTAMGHKSISSTQHYIKPNMDKINEVLTGIAI